MADKKTISKEYHSDVFTVVYKEIRVFSKIPDKNIDLPKQIGYTVVMLRTMVTRRIRGPVLMMHLSCRETPAVFGCQCLLPG
jgi:hypothetical protein